MGKYLNASTIYTEKYTRFDFRDSMSYDIGIHAIQTALYIQGYNNKAHIDVNNIVFGYYDVYTEKMIKQFQIGNRMKPAEGILNKETWNAIFNGLALTKKIGLVITGEQEITIVDNDEYLDLEKYIISESENFNDIDKNLPYSDGSSNFINNGNYTASDDLSGESFGKNSYNYITDIKSSGLNGIIDDYLTGDGGYSGFGFGEYLINGSITSSDPEDYKILGKKVVVPGGNSLTEGSNRWNDTSISSLNYSDYQKDYDFIYNLLANTVYSAGGYTNPLQLSNSTIDSLDNYLGSYESSSNKPFFNPGNINTLRKSKFDITIVYGAKGEKARKLISVVPMSVTQEMNASGEPIYDVYEFVAQDVVYSN